MAHTLERIASQTADALAPGARRGTVFPWRRGNRFELLIDGEQFFPRMLDAITRATRQIEVELYLIEDGKCSDRLVDALAAAASRGVAVRCLFDGFGSLKLGQPLRTRLHEAGVEVMQYNPLNLRRGWANLFRDHRKLLLVDDTYGYVGGAGSTDEFWLPDEAAPWHEIMVEMSGPLLQDWRALFDQLWAHCQRSGFWSPRVPLRPARLPPAPSGGDREGCGRVAYTASRQHRDIVHALLRNLSRAEHRVWLATPYFLPTWRVRRALVKAARRGVDVRLLLTSRNTDHPPIRFAGQRYYPRLLRAGVRIFEYQPKFLHMKMVLVDDWVSLGSCNFDHWNLRWNLENNLESVDPQLIADAQQCLTNDFVASREITLERWHERPLAVRVYQRIWGWLDRLVINVLDRRR
ncbi:phospholipase D-like domain-containing protein [Pseudomonas matsuisoli]|uniref:Cardiolipin synthase B n=1 Tax=Pseudomonas matsuisoli TaxID=1515666 RepID=A0A917UXD5_9PSED|nr:phosphatidylserine/phosphatidylglycerophosphate/cardiolipin synthase family protein [Pseudomonas matsuisoli]GGJ92838.1 cardiolipin synthase B [Pseudomonas matsuisoli]